MINNTTIIEEATKPYKQPLGKLVFKDTPSTSQNLFQYGSMNNAYVDSVTTSDGVGYRIKHASGEPLWGIVESTHFAPIIGHQYRVKLFIDGVRNTTTNNGMAYVYVCDKNGTIIVGDWITSTYDHFTTIPSNAASIKVLLGGLVKNGSIYQIVLEDSVNRLPDDEFADSGDTVLYSSDFKSFETVQSAGVSDQLTVGATVSSQLTMSVKGDKLPAYLQGVEVKPYFGYMVDGSPVYIQKGRYFINDGETERGSIYTKLHAYDAFLWEGMDLPPDYHGESVSISNIVDYGYTGTVKGLLTFLKESDYADSSWPFSWSDVAERFESSFASDYDLKTEFDDSMTRRDILSRIAVELGTNISSLDDAFGQDSFGFVKKNDVSELLPSGKITTAMYKSNGLKLGGKNAMLISGYSLDLQQEGEEENVTLIEEPVSIPSGSNRFSFTEDSLKVKNAGALDVRNNLHDLWTRFSNLYSTGTIGNNKIIEYQPFDLDCTGLPFLQPMDVFECDARVDGHFPSVETVTIMPITVTNTYNGAISTKLTAADMDSNSMSVKSTSSSDKTELVAANAYPAIAFFSQLKANEITANTIISNFGKFDQLDVTRLSADALNAAYADIALANVKQLDVNKLLAKSAIITNAVVEEGYFTGKLTAVEIDAGLIKSGTLVAKRILLEGEDGLLYNINAKNIENVSTDELHDTFGDDVYTKLHGDNIIAGTITATQISVSDLSAFRATIGGFYIAENAIKMSSDATFENPGGLYFDNIVGDDNKTYARFAVANANGGIRVDLMNDRFDLDVSQVSVKEDISFGNYLWDVSGTGATQRLILKWGGN